MNKNTLVSELFCDTAIVMKKLKLEFKVIHVAKYPIAKLKYHLVLKMKQTK